MVSKLETKVIKAVAVRPSASGRRSMKVPRDAWVVIKRRGSFLCCFDGWTGCLERREKGWVGLERKTRIVDQKAEEGKLLS